MHTPNLYLLFYIRDHLISLICLVFILSLLPTWVRVREMRILTYLNHTKVFV